MQNEAERTAAYFNAPYRPNGNLPADARTAQALEYIAAQLFLIRRSLDKEHNG